MSPSSVQKNGYSEYEGMFLGDSLDDLQNYTTSHSKFPRNVLPPPTVLKSAYPEDGGSMFLRNLGKDLPVGASHLRGE
jgi:hypothetical protein